MLEMNKIYCMNCLEGMKQIEDNSIDCVITDPPYALGSEMIIRKDGKPDYKKATDFMNKWEQPDGKFWEEWFKEAFRILKFGGRIVMFGMDRQLMLNKYYGCLAGFIEQQSMYWYFISNFPKASDLSKNLDKNAGVEREVIGKSLSGVGSDSNSGCYEMNNGSSTMKKEIDITMPKSDLAKKYDGFKYSISPLKQTTETIMIFQKPYKTGSCLHDTLAYENGDTTCCCGALNIDGERIATNELTPRNNNNTETLMKKGFEGKPKLILPNELGRYPSQTLVDEETAKILDEQSGIEKNNGHWSKSKVTGFGKFGGGKVEYFGIGEKDEGIGGCSKILHKCKYDAQDFDLYFYCPKVDTNERNMNMGDSEDLKFNSDVLVPQRNDRLFNPTKNNHPTLKPISLMTHILNLFKTPNPQIILDPFAGSGSTLIAAKQLNFQWIGFEINKAYCDIAKTRMRQGTLFDLEEKGDA